MPSTDTPSVDVGPIIDSQRFGFFNAITYLWLFTVLLIEGYDSGIVGFSAPFIAQDLHLGREAIGALLSASVAGILIGGPLFGYIGSRFGRRPGIVAGAVVVGLPMVAAVWATGPTELVILRFIAGIGIGGVMPLAFVMSMEFAPRHLRATLTAAAATGVAVGGVLAALSAGVIGPNWGWKPLFLIGGVAPLAAALLIWLFGPESPKYLAIKNSRNKELCKTLGRMRPDLSFSPDVQFTVSDKGQQGAIKFVSVFLGPLAVLTPVLWISVISIGMIVYFVQSWTPTILTAAGYTPQLAAFASSAFQIGAVIGPLLIGMMVDRFGMRSLVVSSALTVPLVIMLGNFGHSLPLTCLALFGIGFTAIGSYVGLISCAGAFYPSPIRSIGVGMMSGLQKIGSLAGALAGIVLASLSMSQAFSVVALPAVIAMLGCALLVRLRSKSLIQNYPA